MLPWWREELRMSEGGWWRRGAGGMQKRGRTWTSEGHLQRGGGLLKGWCWPTNSGPVRPQPWQWAARVACTSPGSGQAECPMWAVSDLSQKSPHPQSPLQGAGLPPLRAACQGQGWSGTRNGKRGCSVPLLQVHLFLGIRRHSLRRMAQWLSVHL